MTENRKLQLLQASIVDDIDRICSQNGLRYYMIGGTLLGAVRHRGFIPWDDDIDLVMYRADYDRLLEIIREQYADRYFVQTFHTDPHYARYIAKIRLNGTTLVEDYLRNAKSNAGVYVDIFPLDMVRKPDGPGLVFRGRLIRWMFAYKSVKHDAVVRSSGFRYLAGKGLRWTTYLIPDKLVTRLFDYVCAKDNGKDCPYVTNFASHFKWKKQMFPNEYFGEGCRLPFEGRMFAAPLEYEAILKRLYGERYMELPPPEKRETHQIVKLDLGPYENAPFMKEEKDTAL